MFVSVHSWFLLSAVAHNNLFLPGDAFFSSRFSADFFEKQKTESVLDLSYERYAANCTDCGWFGYENLSIRDVPAKTRENLKAVHALLFRLFPDEALRNPFDPDEKPWFPLFVYGRDFSLGLPVGLKFNETSAVEQALSDKAIYDHFDDIDLITEDLASQADVAPLPLDVAYADLVARLDGAIVREPLTADAADLQFVILTGGQVREFALRKEGLSFFVVGDTVRRFRFDARRAALPEPVDAKPTRLASQWNRVREDLRLLRTALDIARRNNGGTMPEEADTGWLKRFFDKPPVDPWGRPYDYNGIGVFLRPFDG